MKKLFIIVAVSLVFGSMGWSAYWLTGLVEYNTGGNVGGGKPVYIQLSSTHIDTVRTQSNGWYQYSFAPGTYIEKVSCAFPGVDGDWYGYRNIYQELYSDTQYNITVYFYPSK